MISDLKCFHLKSILGSILDESRNLLLTHLESFCDGSEKPEYLTIERHVKNFLNSRYFKYLDAINNNIKHYGLVGISSHVSCDDWSNGVHDFVIQGFSHNGNLIPSKRASKFVNFERDMLFKRIIVIGIALNKAVLCTT